MFEKKIAEKLHKPRRKETITEILKNSVKNLERFRHPKVSLAMLGEKKNKVNKHQSGKSTMSEVI